MQICCRLPEGSVLNNEQGGWIMEPLEKNVSEPLDQNNIDNSQNFHDAQIILRAMLCGLEDLQKQYPKYIKLEVK